MKIDAFPKQENVLPITIECGYHCYDSQTNQIFCYKNDCRNANELVGVINLNEMAAIKITLDK